MGLSMSEERLGVRVPSEAKRLIEQAAELDGRSVSDFVRRAAETRARTVLERHRASAAADAARIVLDPETFDAFIAACDAPPVPNAALRKALDRARDFGAE